MSLHLLNYVYKNNNELCRSLILEKGKEISNTLHKQDLLSLESLLIGDLKKKGIIQRNDIFTLEMLFNFILKKNGELIDYTIKNGDFHETKDQFYQRCMIVSIEENKPDVMKFFFDLGYKPGTSKVSISLKNLIHIAARTRSYKVFYLLFEMNNECDETFMLNLIPISRGDKRIIDFLFKNGLSISVCKMQLFQTGLIYDNFDILMMLKSNGFNYEEYKMLLIDCIVHKNSPSAYFDFFCTLNFLDSSTKNILKQKIKEEIDDRGLTFIPDEYLYITEKIGFKLNLEFEYFKIPEDFKYNKSDICLFTMDELEGEILVCSKCKNTFGKENLEKWWNTILIKKCPLRCASPIFYLTSYKYEFKQNF